MSSVAQQMSACNSYIAIHSRKAKCAHSYRRLAVSCSKFCKLESGACAGIYCFISHHVEKIERNVLNIEKRSAKWTFPKAAVISNFHLPVRSFEIKNRKDVVLKLRLVDSHLSLCMAYDYLYLGLLQRRKLLRLITAIKTPYVPDGRFDLEAYDSLVHMQIEQGTEGLIVGGTTGEGQLMSWDKHIMLIGHTVNCFGGLVKVIGNTGSNSTSEAIHTTEQDLAVGMHAALHISPYFGKTSLEDLISHFESVLRMGPTIIYNVLSRTGQDTTPNVINILAQSPNLAGVKEC